MVEIIGNIPTLLSPNLRPEIALKSSSIDSILQQRIKHNFSGVFLLQITELQASYSSHLSKVVVKNKAQNFLIILTVFYADWLGTLRLCSIGLAKL